MAEDQKDIMESPPDTEGIPEDSEHKEDIAGEIKGESKPGDMAEPTKADEEPPAEAVPESSDGEETPIAEEESETPQTEAAPSEEMEPEPQAETAKQGEKAPEPAPEEPPAEPEAAPPPIEPQAAAEAAAEPAAEPSAEPVPAAPGKKKKINHMSLMEIEARLKDLRESQGGLDSKYAKQLLLRKKTLTVQ
jgi:hypothetical protein